MDEQYTNYDRQPAHLFRPGATYFLTCKTRNALPLLAEGGRRQELLDSLEFACNQRGWERLAWVVLPNHYHCLLNAPADDASALSELLRSVHKFTARRWNKADNAQGRQVWYQYWDVCIESIGSFWARLNYIHYNPVKHRYVTDPGDYPWSSYHLWLSYGTDALDQIEATYPWDRLDLE